jgi:hypothetical protein
MIGKKNGAIALLQRQVCDEHEIKQYYCVIHQQARCNKVLKFEHVMSVVVSHGRVSTFPHRFRLKFVSANFG